MAWVPPLLQLPVLTPAVADGAISEELWPILANINQNEKVFSGVNPPLNGWNSLPSDTPGFWPDFPVAGHVAVSARIRTRETARPVPEG